LSFLVPIIQNLLIENYSNINLNQRSSSSTAYPRAIVIAPGRELASQIVSVAQSLLVNTGLTVELAIGGTPYTRNVDSICKVHPDIIIGTPGRMAELIIGRPGEDYSSGNSKKSSGLSGKVKISGVRCIVLDEFDALLQYTAHVEPTVAIMDALFQQHGCALQRILCLATASDVIHIESYLKPG
jgi:superfamily II DNA/RNA helicase